MMGKDRLDIFDNLDTTLCGFLTAEQVHAHYEEANFTKIPFHLVISALHYVCGLDTRECKRDQFLPLLTEIERRQQLQEQIYWDFRSLDARNRGRLSLKDTLFLFKSTLQDDFTLKVWDSFLENRPDSDADVTLAELQWALLEPPVHGNPASAADLFSKQAELEACTNERDFEEYSMLMELQRDPAEEEQKNREWRRSMRRESRRKVKQIRRYGLDGILMSKSEVTFDDDNEPEDNLESRQSRELRDLEARYENAEGRLLWEMLRLKIGEVEWAAMPNEAKQARLSKLKASQKKLQRDGCFDQIGCLLGKPVSMVVDINTLTGLDQRQYDKIMKEKMAKRRRKLAQGHRLDPDEREQTSDDVFIQLQLRYDQEKEAILSMYAQQRSTSDKVTRMTIEKALEQKYEALEETLFVEVLREKLGDVEWEMLTLEQRKAKRMKLKLRLNRERKEGNTDQSLDIFVGIGCPKQSQISLLFGDVESQEDIQFTKDCNIRETFVELQKRKELEWQRLEALSDQQTPQKDLQLHLAHLLLAKEFVCRETDFHRAVIMAGLCEKKGLLDRSVWLDELAAEREKASRVGDKVLNVEAHSDLLPDNRGVLSIQEKIIKELVRKHAEEVCVLLQMAADPTVQQQMQNVKKRGLRERQLRSSELMKERMSWRAEATNSSATNQISFLEEALSLHSAVIHDKLAEQQDSTIDPITLSSVITSILIALQQQQLEETQETIQTMLGKRRRDLLGMLETQIQLRSGGYHDNLAAVLLHAETTDLEIADEPEESEKPEAEESEMLEAKENEKPEVEENEKPEAEESENSGGEEEQFVELTKEDEFKMMQNLEKMFIEEQSQLLQVLTNKELMTRLSPERPMSASLQKRISEFKMRRLMSEDQGAVSDSEMDFKRRERRESAKKQISIRIKLLQRRKREERQQRIADHVSDDEMTIDGRESTTSPTPDSSVTDIPSGTQLMLNNEEAKRKMKELERLFELKKQALVESIQKHEQKTQERKKSISSTTISSQDTPSSSSRRKSKSRLKQRTLTKLQNEAELLAQQAFMRENFLDQDNTIPKKDVVQQAGNQSPAAGVPSVQVTQDIDKDQLDAAKQQEIAGSLVTQAKTHEKSVEEEKSRQNEILKNRLLQMKNRRQSELTLVLGEGQKQKEQLESKMKEEKERQLAKVKERVTQVRYERTLTMAADTPTSEGERSFSKLLNEEEKQLNVDDRMTAVAHRMQDTFFKKAEEEAASPTTERKATLQVDSLTPTRPRTISERMKERKKKRQARRVSNTFEAAQEEESNEDS